MKSEGLGLFRARKKNNGEWLEGYYCRALETAEHGSAVYHFTAGHRLPMMGKAGAMMWLSEIFSIEPFPKKWTEILHKKPNKNLSTKTAASCG